MNSLQELNTYSNTSITYTDNRDANVVYNVYPYNNITTVERNQTFSVPSPVLIDEIINPAVAATQYTIDVSTIPGATVSWGTLAPGLTVTNPSTGVYVLSGITSASQWADIKNPTITPPAILVGTFSYNATLSWSSGTYTWSLILNILEVEFFEDPAPINYFSPSTVDDIDTPGIITDKSGTYTITITPSQPSYITTIATTLPDPGGVCSFNNTTKVFTITGSNATVKSFLAAVRVTYSASGNSDFTFAFTGTCTNPDVGSDGVNGSVIYAAFLLPAEQNGVYRTALFTNPGDTPTVTNNIADANADLSLSYQLTVAGTNNALIDTMRSVKYGSYPISTYINDPNTGTKTQLFGLNTLFIRNDLIAISDHNFGGGLTSGQGRGAVYIYKKITGTWTLTQTLLSNFTTLVNFGIYLSVSADGEYLTVSQSRSTESGNSNLALYIYKKNPDDTFSFQQSFLNQGNLVATPFTGFQQTSMNSDGSRMANKNNIFTRSGSTWSLSYSISGNLGPSKLSNDGNYLLKSNLTSTTNSAIISISLFYFNGTTWTEQLTINKTDFAGATSSWGRAFDINSDATEICFSDQFADKAYVYKKTNNVWSLSQTLNSQTNSGYSFGIDIKFSRDNKYLMIGSESETVNFVGNYAFYVRSNDQWLGIFQEDSDWSRFNDVAFSLNLDSTELLRVDRDTPNRVKVCPLTEVGYSWNNSTKVLTLTGTKNAINYMLDNFELKSAAAVISNITLNYTVTTPASATQTRSQTITNIG